LAVLSTYSAGQPYLSLVAFAVTGDLDRLLFVTDRSTRKFANILEHPRIAMLVDNRSNRESDFSEASAATFLGEARELVGRERDAQLRVYLNKHPSFEGFAASAKCAVIQLEVETVILVDGFSVLQDCLR
jgi:nitroimidazol reductase NimA-like FMN-containing flavoprotein (pyridoxamine 5'-phosphate oxidase superfamily)